MNVYRECVLGAALRSTKLQCTHLRTRVPPAGEDGAKRAMQIWRLLYYDGRWVQTLEAAAAERGVQNGFSRAFLDRVAPLASAHGGLELQAVHRAADGTRKLVFRVTCGPGAGGQVGGWMGAAGRAGGVQAEGLLRGAGSGEPVLGHCSCCRCAALNCHLRH